MVQQKKPKIYAVVGPTASGKTSLAIQLAQHIGGEVISADSRQVYRELDIGTEKVTTAEMEGVPHHCIDIASPRRAFSVAQWRRHAEKAIHQITSRGAVPIVAGGSGLYVDSLVYGTVFPAVKPNMAIRAKLARLSTQQLHEKLQALDPVRASTIEKENPRRLIRAIEIATALGAVPVLAHQTPLYDTTWIGLNPGAEVLEERIRNRLSDTLQKGLLKEVCELREILGLSWQRIDELGLEYRIMAAHLRGTLPKEEVTGELFRELRRYAKRQMRWLKRNKEIQWYASGTQALQHYVDIKTRDS